MQCHPCSACLCSVVSPEARVLARAPCTGRDQRAVAPAGRMAGSELLLSCWWESLIACKKAPSRVHTCCTPRTAVVGRVRPLGTLASRPCRSLDGACHPSMRVP